MRLEKGFTLVELMAILVILAVMMLVTVPSITRTLKDSQKNEMAEYEKTVCLAAQTYMQVEHRDSNLSVHSYTVSLEELRKGGYITESLKNPTTDSYDGNVEIFNKDGKITCTLR